MNIRGLKNLSIRSQLYGSSIVTGLMLLLLVGVAGLQLQKLSGETTQLSSETNVFMSALDNRRKAAATMALPQDAAAGRGGSLDSYARRHRPAGRCGPAASRRARPNSGRIPAALNALKRADAEARPLFAHLAADAKTMRRCRRSSSKKLSSEFSGILRKVNLDTRQALGARLDGVEVRAKAPLRSLIHEAPSCCSSRSSSACSSCAASGR